MPEFLLKLMGVPGADVARVVDVSLNLRGGSGWLVLLGAALVAMAIWLYRRYSEHVPRWHRIGMTTLRSVFLGLLVLLLMRPVLQLTIEGSIRRAVAVLIDGSSSMQIEDDRLGDDRKRAAIALGRLNPTGGLEQEARNIDDIGRPPRIRLVRSLLRNEQLRLLPRLADEFDIRPYRFGSSLDEIAVADARSVVTGDWLDTIKTEDASTRLGDAIRELLGRSRGQPLAGIVLVTDGASNSGSPVTAAAEMARQQGVPLYVWGVGITSPREVAVTSLFAPEVAFFDDEVPVGVRIRSQGMAGRTTRLRLQLVPEQPDNAPAVETIEQEIVLADGEQVVPLILTPQKEREDQQSAQYRLVATIQPTGEESNTENLTRSQPLRVVDGKIKVLYVERAPRWEYRFLQAMLMRDRRVTLKTVLLEAAPGLSSDPNGPYLPSIPTDRQELFSYDLIILGDVNPRTLPSSQLEAMEEFVSKFGGGMLVIAGPRHALKEIDGTVLERMLPVESIRGATAAAAVSREITVELTTQGRQSTMLRLSEDETESAALWARLPPILWIVPSVRAKPAADVLLVDPQRVGGAGDRTPIFAIHQYGLGQVFYAGTDQTWRWRRIGDEYHVTLWTQIVRRLALPHLLGESKRTQLSTDQQEYATGDRVTVYARLYDQNYAPIVDPDVRATYRSRTGIEGQVLMRREQPGVYRGEFVAPQAGAYELYIESDPTTVLTFSVGAPRLELSQTAMNEALLQQIAAASGGAYYREENLHELPDQLRTRTERIKSTHDVEIWSSPLYFLLVLLVVSAEWVWRKAAQLK